MVKSVGEKWVQINEYNLVKISELSRFAVKHIDDSINKTNRWSLITYLTHGGVIETVHQSGKKAFDDLDRLKKVVCGVSKEKKKTEKVKKPLLRKLKRRKV